MGSHTLQPTQSVRIRRGSKALHIYRGALTPSPAALGADVTGQHTSAYGPLYKRLSKKHSSAAGDTKNFCAEEFKAALLDEFKAAVLEAVTASQVVLIVLSSTKHVILLAKLLKAVDLEASAASEVRCRVSGADCLLALLVLSTRLIAQESTNSCTKLNLSYASLELRRLESILISADECPKRGPGVGTQSGASTSTSRDASLPPHLIAAAATPSRLRYGDPAYRPLSQYRIPSLEYLFLPSPDKKIVIMPSRPSTCILWRGAPHQKLL